MRELLLVKASASTVQNSGDFPSLGIDGNRATSAVSMQDLSKGPVWIKFHLQRTVHVRKIALTYMYPDGWFDPKFSCVNRWNACVLAESNVSISLISGTEQISCGMWNLKSGRKAEDQVYEFQCEAEAEEVLLSKPNSNIALYELQLFGDYGRVYPPQPPDHRDSQCVCCISMLLKQKHKIISLVRRRFYQF